MIDVDDVDAVLVGMDQLAFAAGVDRHARLAIIALSVAGRKHNDVTLMARARELMTQAITEAEAR